MTGDRLGALEDLLRRRALLWERSIAFQGASERSPDYGPEDQAAWERVTDELRRCEHAMSGLAAELRAQEPARFAGWVAERRRLHELRLAAPDIRKWEIAHLRGTIARWERFLHEDFDDFHRWISW
ncbi:MAG: hypothetical protein IT542_05710 [Rubellimicrobium sp.]|nr:hypothetical protein [Rubellimicrobium sp.]